LGDITGRKFILILFHNRGTAWGDGYWGATFSGKQWGTWFQTTY